MKKLIISIAIVSAFMLSACDGKKNYHDITDTDSISTETAQADDQPFLDDNTTPLNDEEMMQAEAICGQWGWVDTDKEDDFPLLLTLEMVDDQVAVFSCALYGSTIGDITPQCSYRNGVLKIEDKNGQRHMKVQLELNPRGDFVGTYYLKLNPDNISEGKLTLRQGYYKYGEENEEE